MFVDSVYLNIECDTCQNKEYVEHENGFYVCNQCGLQTNIRHGMALDFKDQNFQSKDKVKMKIEDNDENTLYHGNTNVNTTVNTCSNSEYSDNTSIRSKNGLRMVMMTLEEVFDEHTLRFLKIFKAFFNYISIEYIPKELIKHDKLYENFYNNLLSKARLLWIKFLKEELTIQKKVKKPVYRKQNIRSRRNTEDESGLNGNGNLYFSDRNKFNNNNNYCFNQKSKDPTKNSLKNRINQEYSNRRIKKKNVSVLEDYQKLKSTNANKYRKFIEEYDQVLQCINEMKEVLINQADNDETILKDFSSKFIDFLYSDSKLNNISFQDLIKVATLSNVSFLKKDSFEELIHNFFINKELNYASFYSENKFNEQKSKLNADNYLKLVFSIFNSLNNFDFLILEKDLINFYKYFNCFNLQDNELKYLKYINKENLLKLCQNVSLKETNIIYSYNIVCTMLNLPNTFTDFCSEIHLAVLNKINNNQNHIYHKDVFILSVIIYAFKLFYGLNDLPYLVEVLKSVNVFECEILQQRFIEITNKDKIFKYFNELPSFLNLINTLKINLINEKEKYAPVHYREFKKNYSLNYKSKYVNYINNQLYPNKDNLSSIKSITEMEKLINSLVENEKLNISENLEKMHIDKDLLEHNISNDYDRNLKINLKKSEKFTKKLNKDKNKKILNPFIKEEIDFYSKSKISKNSVVEVPLPCDTYVQFTKKAFKFADVTPPVSELIIMYFFSDFFNIEYKLLKKTVKMIEKFIEEKR